MKKRIHIESSPPPSPPSPPSPAQGNTRRRRMPTNTNRVRRFRNFRPLSDEKKKERQFARQMFEHNPLMMGFFLADWKDSDMSRSTLSDVRIKSNSPKVKAKRALSRDEQRTSTPGNANVGRTSVEVERALPEDANTSGGGVGYQGYGSSGATAGSFDGRMEADRFPQPQTTGGSYSNSAYGFEAPSDNPAYGGYGGYGAANAGFSGPGTSESTWSNQTPEYSASGYGASAGASWNAPGSGQSTNGTSGYVIQGYGYGNYGGNSPNAGSGNSGGEQQGGYPPYSGYNNSAYGFGAPRYNPAYGGYGKYGAANAGFSGPAGPYGNPSAAYSGYAGGAPSPSTLNNSWSNQTPGGYGENAGYGAGVPWNAPGSGGAANAPVGQSANGASWSGNQVYGYFSDGGNAPNAGSSNSGGEKQGSGAGGYHPNNGSGY